MEIELGKTVITLVEKDETEFVDQRIHLPKGLVGVVCDDAHISDGWVLVEFNQKDILGKGSGVYAYKISEIKAYDR